METRQRPKQSCKMVRRGSAIHSALFVLFLHPCLTNAQPNIQWQRCFGGLSGDRAYSLCPSADGGFAVAGYTFSSDGDVTDFQGTRDVWVLKLDPLGNLEWQKCLGGTNGERAYCIQPTNDGGYVVAGQTNSNDGDVIGLHEAVDGWVIKLSADGDIEWQRCVGGVYQDNIQSVAQTSDGGYILAGTAGPDSGDIVGNHGGGYSDAWVVKLSPGGELQWQKCLGGSYTEGFSTIAQTGDGGYLAAGHTLTNNDGDVSGNHGGEFGDAWAVKLSSTGVMEWQRCVGGSDSDGFQSVQETASGDFLLVGETLSNDGDVLGNHGEHDAWIVKLGSSGELLWQKCLGGSDEDRAYSVKNTTDGGCVLSGYALSIDGDVSGIHDGPDAWVVKLNATGALEWQRCYGGSDVEAAYAIQSNSDGTYVIAGHTGSDDGEVTGNHGYEDIWCVKLGPVDVGLNDREVRPLSVVPNPTLSSVTIRYSNGITPTSASIHDVTGRTVLFQTVAHPLIPLTFDLSEQENGVYCLQIRLSDGSIVLERVVKE